MALLEKYSSSGPYQRMRHFLLTPLLLLIIGSASADADPLQPFTSDGCSAFPNGTSQQQSLWLGCCQAHDAAYWAGGTFEQRTQADEALKTCVENKGEVTISWLMLIGVKVGGSPFWPTNFRWGFGWPYLRGYQVLDTSEVHQIRQGWPADVSMPEYLHLEKNQD